MRIGIVGKTDKKEVFEITKKVCKWLQKRKVEVYVERKLAVNIGHTFATELSELPEYSDVVLVFGGDGTFLTVSRLVGKHGIPILGVNLGGLGFLTEITIDELYDMLERVISGDYCIEKRDMLAAVIKRDSETIGPYIVLNDVVINKGAVAKIIELSLSINGSYVTTFRADGLIFSTPTGSTAYSLSAGGPIVHPTLPITVITPISPHTLTNRPLVVSSDTLIQVSVLTGTKDIYLTLDGQVGVTLEKGDDIELRKSDTSVKLIRSPFRDYFAILKTKLMWGGRYGML